MNKLLLLATSLFSFVIITHSADRHIQSGTFAYVAFTGLKDSIIKDELDANPKKGFKDLFTESSNGLNNSRLNPKAISFVQDYIDVHAARLNKMKGWGKPYFNLISSILSQHGLPIELKYLSVIESDLKSSAVSWAGAVGPWQLMPSTARDLGLIVNRSRDERRDYYKSSNAAARYLTELFGLFNDWLLVIAAYNGGPSHVYSAIRKSGSRNFWDLQYYLPAESRNHVKKFIATHYIMEGEGGVTTQTRKETDNLLLIPDATDSLNHKLNITGKYNSFVLAQVISMNIINFNTLNPDFDKLLSEKGNYDLHLPADKMEIFLANKSRILDQSVRFILSSSNR